MTWTQFSLSPPIGDAATILSKAGGALKTLIAHPWMHGVGEGSGHYRYLSFPNAAGALSAVLQDETDAVFGLAVTAASFKDFGMQVKALTDAFPIRQFDQARVRAEQLVTLETDKFILPNAPGLLSGGALSLASMPRMADIQKAATMQQAKAAATSFESSNPLTNLQAHQSAAAAASSAVDNALDNAKALFTGGAAWRFYAASDAANAIKSGPGHEYTITAMMLFIGSAADLALLREIAP
ncbi:MAG: hypothetical protein ACR65O_05270 [Methylomicrobium sp.]